MPSCPTCPSQNFRIAEPFWFGPPAYRIPVGGAYAIPGPVRDKKYDAASGGNFPGNYWDHYKRRCGTVPLITR